MPAPSPTDKPGAREGLFGRRTASAQGAPDIIATPGMPVAIAPSPSLFGASPVDLPASNAPGFMPIGSGGYGNTAGSVAGEAPQGSAGAYGIKDSADRNLDIAPVSAPAMVPQIGASPCAF